VGVHRSRYELERILGRYGASDFAFVETDATASIQFAMHGRYVQLALPLPDPTGALFTHTPTGRPRGILAQERAYEQALREHWRALVLAVRGKLQSVESGISTFDEEFKGFLVQHFHEEPSKRRAPKAVNWLLGSSHTAAIGLVAAFFLPASAVGAFALPPSVVDHLSVAFSRSSSPGDRIASSDVPRAIAFASGDWSSDSEAKSGTYASALGDSTADELSLPGHDAGNAGSPAPMTDNPPPSGSNELAVTVTATEPTAVSQSNTGPAQGSTAGDSPSPPPPSNGGRSADNAAASGGNSSFSGGDQPVAAPPVPDGGTSKGAGKPADGETTESGAPSGAGSNSPPTTTVDPTGSTPAPHDNGNHNGADKEKNGADKGKKADATTTTTTTTTTTSTTTTTPTTPTTPTTTPTAPANGNGNGNGNGNVNGNGNGNVNGNGNGNGKAKEKPAKGKP
jgi:hypothetical protein